MVRDGNVALRRRQFALQDAPYHIIVPALAFGPKLKDELPTTIQAWLAALENMPAAIYTRDRSADIDLHERPRRPVGHIEVDLCDPRNGGHFAESGPVHMRLLVCGCGARIRQKSFRWLLSPSPVSHVRPRSTTDASQSKSDLSAIVPRVCGVDGRTYARDARGPRILLSA
jgi:hypothetical protein